MFQHVCQNKSHVIRERNERGFRSFLQNLKAVFHLFLTPGNEQLTNDALLDARQYLLDAKGTLSRDTREQALILWEGAKAIHSYVRFSISVA